jgi:hypothetical protein
MVVVASLLEKVPNLGGLTRTCEIFQAEALVLGDLAVARDPEFTSVSVTAEHHVPMRVRTSRKSWGPPAQDTAHAHTSELEPRESSRNPAKQDTCTTTHVEMNAPLCMRVTKGVAYVQCANDAASKRMLLFRRCDSDFVTKYLAG